jgi:DNA-binding GntR family transcriptional regulator
VSARQGIGRPDAVALATERLRQLIVTGELAPGSELSQVRLAELTGVSTTPVREALRRLEAEGLVESRHNRRPRVPAFDADDLDAVYAARILLETTAVAITVPVMTAADLAILGEDLEAMRSAGRVEDVESWEAAHACFHERLIAGAGEALPRQIQMLMARSLRYRRMSVLGERPHGWSTGEVEHGSILAACERHDVAAAAPLLATHLARSAVSVLDHLGSGEPPRAIIAALRALGVADEELRALGLTGNG